MIVYFLLLLLEPLQVLAEDSFGFGGFGRGEKARQLGRSLGKCALGVLAIHLAIDFVLKFATVRRRRPFPGIKIALVALLHTTIIINTEFVQESTELGAQVLRGFGDVLYPSFALQFIDVVDAKDKDRISNSSFVDRDESFIENSPRPSPIPSVEVPSFISKPTLCEDSDDWHKRDDTSKNCLWVSALLRRCFVVGEDGTRAYEKCSCICQGVQAPTTAPPTTFLPTTIPTKTPTTNYPTVAPTTSSPTALNSPSNHSPTIIHATTHEPSIIQLTTNQPSLLPKTSKPTTLEPTSQPSLSPTLFPIILKQSPTSMSPMATDRSETPTQIPTYKATEEPTLDPTPRPTQEPTYMPTLVPTSTPTLAKTPTPKPTRPVLLSTPEPTPEPTVPTPKPTTKPTEEPTPVPTPEPTPVPTPEPTPVPTLEPTPVPRLPSESLAPSKPTSIPPSPRPTPLPSNPTQTPTKIPTKEATREPTAAIRTRVPEPSLTPTTASTIAPSRSPHPSSKPSLPPHDAIPTILLQDPTARPQDIAPTSSPTALPQIAPTIAVTIDPTNSLVLGPTASEIEEAILDRSIVLGGISSLDFGSEEKKALKNAIQASIEYVYIQNLTINDFIDSNNERRQLEEDSHSETLTLVSFVCVYSAPNGDVNTFDAELTKVLSTGKLQENIQIESSSTALAETEVQVEISIALIPTSAPVLQPTQEPTDDSQAIEDGGSTDSGGSGGSESFMLLGIGFVAALLLAGIAFCVYYFKPYRTKTASRYMVQSFARRESQRVTVESDNYDDDDYSSFMEDVGAPPLKPNETNQLKSKETYWVRHRVRHIVFDDIADDGDEKETESSGRCIINWSPSETTSDDQMQFIRRIGFDGHLELVPANVGISGFKPDPALKRLLEESIEADFTQRTAAFRQQADSLRVDWTIGRLRVQVTRLTALNDAFEVLADLPSSAWRQPLFITFKGEEGMDAGGLSREFFNLVSEQLFDPSYGVFCLGQTQDITYKLYDDRSMPLELSDVTVRRKRIDFAGKLIGKALLEGHHFAPSVHPNIVLLKHMACEPISLSDLQLVDYELWSSLKKLEVMSDEDLATLDLTFSIDRIDDIDGQVKTHELCENGMNRAVTEKNFSEFLRLRFQERTFDAFKENLTIFLRALYSIIPSEVLMLLSARELELALCGVPELDLAEWRSATEYRGGLTESHDVVIWFWEVLESWTDEKRAQLLSWVTSTTRAPIRGFKHLAGRDGVERAFTLTSVPRSQAKYPRSHTCFNRIDLPLYTHKAELEEGLDFVLHTFSVNENKAFTME